MDWSDHHLVSNVSNPGANSSSKGDAFGVWNVGTSYWIFIGFERWSFLPWSHGSFSRIRSGWWWEKGEVGRLRERGEEKGGFDSRYWIFLECFFLNRMCEEKEKNMRAPPLECVLRWCLMDFAVGFSAITLSETNMAPENNPLEKEIPVGNQHF